MAAGLLLCTAAVSSSEPRPEFADGEAPETWLDWGERADEVVFLGSYTDYKGARGSVYLSPRSMDRIWIMDHDLAAGAEGNRPAPAVGDASGLRALPCGARGRLRYYGVVSMPGEVPVSPARWASSREANATGLQVIEGTFLAFTPGSGGIPASELVARTADPWVLGLLVREPGARKLALAKLHRFRDTFRRTRALSGLLVAGAKGEARTYLNQVALPRGPRDRDLPDLKVLGPWLLDGFKRVPQVPVGEEDLRLSPVRYLLPAARVWMRTVSAQATRAAYYDTVLGQDVGFLLPAPSEAIRDGEEAAPTHGPFERGGFAYADVLLALAPEFYRTVSDAESQVLGYPGYYRNVPVLEVRRSGRDRYLVILDPQTGDLLACRDPRDHGPVSFGARADLLIYAPRDIAEEEEGSILRFRWRTADPAGVVRLLKRSGLGAGVGYLARAAQESAGGFTWRDWEAHVRQAAQAHADGFTALRTREVLAISPSPDTADALRGLLPEIARAGGRVDAGRQGLAVVAAYLAARKFERAGTLLDALPGIIGQSREYQDDQGDLGWENRCGIEVFRILQKRLSGEPAPRPSEELRTSWGSVREHFAEITQGTGVADRERWLNLLLRSGVEGD